MTGKNEPPSAPERKRKDNAVESFGTDVRRINVWVPVALADEALTAARTATRNGVKTEMREVVARGLELAIAEIYARYGGR